MAQTVALPSRESEGSEAMLWALCRVLPARVNAGEVFGAIMCGFTRRLTRGEARQLLMELSPAIRLYFQDCVLHREEPAAAFDRETFLKDLAFKLAERDDRARGVCGARVRPVAALVEGCSARGEPAPSRSRAHVARSRRDRHVAASRLTAARPSVALGTRKSFAESSRKRRFGPGARANEHDSRLSQ